MAPDQVEVLVDHLVFLRIGAPGALELEQQAFAQVARAHPGRLEVVDGVEDLVERLDGKVGQGEQVFDIELEIAVVIDVANHDFGNLFFVVVQSGERELVEQLVVQRGGFGKRIHHVLVFFLGVGPSRNLPAVMVAVELLAERGQLFEFVVELLAIDILGALFDFDLLVGLLHRSFERRVFRKFLLDHLLKVEQRHLEDFQ
jgi:hypothetical protein